MLTHSDSKIFTHSGGNNITHGSRDTYFQKAECGSILHTEVATFCTHSDKIISSDEHINSVNSISTKW